MDPDKNQDDSPAAPPAETPSVNGEATTEAPPAPDAAERDKLLGESRTRLVEGLFGERRPRPAVQGPLVEAYLGAAQDVDAAEEGARLLALVQERHEAAGRAEASVAEKFVQAGRAQIETYHKLFAELDPLLQTLADELAQMKEDDEAFQKAPQELAAALRNHKKGLEIIERMTRRLKERKKEPAAPPEPGALASLPAPAPLADFVPALVQAFHDQRDAAGRACLQARQAAEDAKKEVLNLVKGILGSVDGVDGGLRSEAEVKARLEPFRTEHGALIDAWFAAYHRLGEAFDKFFAATGVAPQTVEPGTPFDPVRMEPAGTVEDPKLKNEDVAAVLRRGFTFQGEPVRPMLVEVVINPPAAPGS